MWPHPQRPKNGSYGLLAGFFAAVMLIYGGFLFSITFEKPLLLRLGVSPQLLEKLVPTGAVERTGAKTHAQEVSSKPAKERVPQPLRPAKPSANQPQPNPAIQKKQEIKGTPLVVLHGRGALRLRVGEQGEEQLIGAEDPVSGGLAFDPAATAYLIEVHSTGEGWQEVNINDAPLQILKELPGIDAILAAAIDSYRKEQTAAGALAFDTIGDLARVSGISTELVDALRPLLSAENAANQDGGEDAVVGEDQGGEDAKTLPLTEKITLMTEVANTNPSQREWRIQMPGAVAITVDFAQFSLPVEQPLTLLDADGRAASVFGGDLKAFRAPPVEGSEVILRWDAPEAGATGVFQLQQAVGYFAEE